VCLGRGACQEILARGASLALHPLPQWCHGAGMRAALPLARRVREYAQALGFLALGIAVVLGLGWLTLTLFWAAIAEAD
jgi:hypothetical protein